MPVGGDLDDTLSPAAPAAGLSSFLAPVPTHAQNAPNWAAAGSVDTKIRYFWTWRMEMQRRKFSREIRLEAMKLVRERGVSASQAARDLNLYETCCAYGSASSRLTRDRHFLVTA